MAARNSQLYRPLGTTGLTVHPIALGALELGRDWAPDVNPVGGHRHSDQKAAINLVHQAVDAGLNFIDTAPAYGSSEEFLGTALKGRRDRVILATKFGESWTAEGGSIYDYSPEGVACSLEKSLRLLQTDYVDLLQIHSAQVDLLRNGEVWQSMDRLRREGKVRFLGFSGHIEAGLVGLEVGGWDVIQVPYSLLVPAASEQFFGLAQNQGVGVLLMRTLCGGKLSAKYRNLEDPAVRQLIEDLRPLTDNPEDPASLTDLAIRYALRPQVVSALLIGTRRFEALMYAMDAAARGPLDDERASQIESLVRSRNYQVW